MLLPWTTLKTRVISVTSLDPDYGFGHHPTMPRLFQVFSIVLLPLALEACASSMCERRDDFLRNRCAGTSVNYTGDATCEAKIARCSDAQKAQFEGYVSCLESQEICSLEALAACAEKWPGGVNLSCTQPR